MDELKEANGETDITAICKSSPTVRNGEQIPVARRKAMSRARRAKQS